jgi:predicted nucleic acid-binding protein
MAYLVDSDWLIDYLADLPVANDLLESLFDEGVAVSVISCIEVYEGIEGGIVRGAQAPFERLLAGSLLLTISQAVSRRCARLRHTLRTQGRRVNQRAMDLLIASTALEHDLTLVTRNLEDYRDIPGLALYPGPGPRSTPG